MRDLGGTVPTPAAEQLYGLWHPSTASSSEAISAQANHGHDLAEIQIHDN